MDDLTLIPIKIEEWALTRSRWVLLQRDLHPRCSNKRISFSKQIKIHEVTVKGIYLKPEYENLVKILLSPHWLALGRAWIIAHNDKQKSRRKVSKAKAE